MASIIIKKLQVKFTRRYAKCSLRKSGNFAHGLFVIVVNTKTDNSEEWTKCNLYNEREIIGESGGGDMLQFRSEMSPKTPCVCKEMNHRTSMLNIRLVC